MSLAVSRFIISRPCLFLHLYMDAYLSLNVSKKITVFSGSLCLRFWSLSSTQRLHAMVCCIFSLSLSCILFCVSFFSSCYTVTAVSEPYSDWEKRHYYICIYIVNGQRFPVVFNSVSHYTTCIMAKDHSPRDLRSLMPMDQWCSIEIL